MITFTIYGRQITQGSKKSHAIYNAKGQPVMHNGRVLTVTRNDNPNLDNWRQQVASAAAREVGDRPLLDGPLALTLLFVMPRPKGHFRTGKNAGVLKDSAPSHHITKPDSLKLGRAIEDALSGVVWGDDSQVVTHVIGKRYGERFETVVTIEEV